MYHSNSSRKRTTVLSYLSSTNLPLSSKTSFTLEIENDESMDGAPNSANTNLSCCAALMPPKKLGEYDTIAEGLK